MKAPVTEEKVKQGLFSSIKSFFSGDKKGAAASSNTQPAQAVPKKKKKREASFDRNLSCEEMDSDDLDGDLNLSDEDSGAQNRRQDMRNQRRADAPKQEEEDREQYAVEFDTNVFKVNLDCLEHRGELVTGDADMCSKC